MADIVSIEEKILRYAISVRASDIHIEPREDEWEIRIRRRGILFKYQRMDFQEGNALVQRFKVKGSMDIGEKRIPQDGSFQYIDVSDGPIDFRLSSLPTIQGEKLTIRILYRTSELFDLKQLGFVQSDYEQLLRWIHDPMGLILVTGSTGSGKTTTLYAILNHLNNGDLNISTIEDPVEFRLSGINQVQVNDLTGLTFAAGLRSLLRHDPDVIMIGEIRDRETADIAIRSSLSGHLVMATMHAIDAPTAITRLLEMGIEPYLITSALKGVISQKMITQICPNCSGDPACRLCEGIGYIGRRPQFELMEINERMSPYILAKRPASEIRNLFNQLELFPALDG